MQQPNLPTPAAAYDSPLILHPDFLHSILETTNPNSERFAYLSSLSRTCRAFKKEVDSQTLEDGEINEVYGEVLDRQSNLHAPGTLRARINSCASFADKVAVLQQTRQCIADAFLHRAFVQDTLGELVLMTTRFNGPDEEKDENYALVRRVMIEPMRADCLIMEQQCFLCHILLAAKLFEDNKEISQYALQLISSLLVASDFDLLGDVGVKIILKLIVANRRDAPTVLAGFRCLLLYSENLEGITKLLRTTRHNVVILVDMIQKQYGFANLSSMVNLKKGTEVLALFLVVPDYGNALLSTILERMANNIISDPTRDNLKICLRVLCMATNLMVDSDRALNGEFGNLLFPSRLLAIILENKKVTTTWHEYIHQVLNILKNLTSLKNLASLQNLAPLDNMSQRMILDATWKICDMLKQQTGALENPVDTLKMIQTLIVFLGTIRTIDGGGGIRSFFQNEFLEMDIIPLIMHRLLQYRNPGSFAPHHEPLVAELVLFLYVLVVTNKRAQIELIKNEAMNILFDIAILKRTGFATTLETRSLYLVCYLLHNNYDYVVMKDEYFTRAQRQYSGSHINTTFDQALEDAVKRPNSLPALGTLFDLCRQHYHSKPVQ